MMMRKLLIILAVLIGIHFQLSAQNSPVNYPVIFCDHFQDSTYTENTWAPNKNFVFTDGKTGRGISITSNRGSVVISTPLSIDSIKVGTIVLEANVKAENISQPPHPWNGIKVMLKITSIDGTAAYLK